MNGNGKRHESEGQFPHAKKLKTDTPHTRSLLFTTTDKPGSLHEALEVIKKHQINLKKIESRPSKSDANKYDFLLNFEENDHTDPLVVDLKKSTESVILLGSEGDVPWFPRKIADLDMFNQKVLEYGSELDADHPGFTDESYRKRRAEIVDVAVNYKHGEKIPRIDYTKDEIATWEACWRKLTQLYPTHACQQFNHVFPLLQQNCGYGESSIPQLEDISSFLKDTTGFSLRPVGGLLSPRDFLNGLAFRVFHSTQYIRHHSKPLYTPEPDVVHELMGHVPLFADREFADFSQAIGLASLGASDEDIEKLSTCYWFTVEFGLCKEGDSVKAFGAGLLSSFGELEYCLTDKPETRPFNPHITGVQSYPITKFQPIYFVAESFSDAKEQMLRYSGSLSRPFSVTYNAYTHSVEILDSRQSLLNLAHSIQTSVAHLHSGINSIDSL